MSTGRKRSLLLVFALLDVLLLVGFLSARAPQAQDPALVAERIEEQLFDVQQRLADDPAAAQTGLDAAMTRHTSELAPRFPPSAALAGQAASAALADARAALAAHDEIALAQARADYRTALLWAGYLAAISSAQSGDSANAAIWLKLRAFKPSTRFNLPSSQATLAIEDLAAGRTTAQAAAAVVRRELDETYHALMRDALWSTVEAANHQFGRRMAEEAALAAGYFRLLHRAGLSGEQGATAERGFTALRIAAHAGDWAAVRREQAALIAILGA